MRVSFIHTQGRKGGLVWKRGGKDCNGESAIKAKWGFTLCRRQLGHYVIWYELLSELKSSKPNCPTLGEHGNLKWIVELPQLEKGNLDSVSFFLSFSSSLYFILPKRRERVGSELIVSSLTTFPSRTTVVVIWPC